MHSGIVSAYHALLPARRGAAGAVLAGILIVLLANGYLTVRQIGFWKDDVALWSRAIAVDPNRAGRPYFQRATAYMKTGNYRKALPDINDALRIAMTKPNAHLHPIYAQRANILQELGDLPGAIADYTRAIESRKGVTDLQRSQYLLSRGLLHELQGRTDLAQEDYHLAGVNPPR